MSDKHSDDEDAYLYGSEDEERPVKKQKTEVPVPEKAPSVEAEDDDDDDEEEDSDDDIEFVIGDSAPKTPGLVVSVPTAISSEESGEKKDATTTVVKGLSNNASTTIDINSVAELDGKPLTQVDLSKLKNKPWRFPGADISDYFNYGFDEFTWTAYCHKQDKTRGEFNPQKVMAQIMGGAAPSGGKMPMGMPPMPMGMPNMPPMPPMPNMPKMPNFMGNNGGNFMPNFQNNGRRQ